MKKLILASVLTAILFASSCANMEMKRIDMAQVDRLNDSLATIPGTRSMHVLQDDDYSKVTIIIGNAALFNAGKEKVEETATKVGMMVLHVLGPTNNISTGIFAVSPKDDDKAQIPEGAITADMKINDLKKVAFPK